jgi:hypothetical protein
VQEERERLRPPHSPVRSDELLEGRDLVEVRPVGAVDDDVRAVGEGIGAPDVPGRVRPEGRERIVALDARLVEVVGAGAADRHRAVRLGAHEQEADPLVVAQGGDHSGVARLQPLQ